MKLQDLVVASEPASSDERQTIWEPLNGDLVVRQVNGFQFAAAIPVGNHFHAVRRERFLVTAGQLRLLVLCDTSTGERYVAENLGPGTVINLPRGIAHALVFEPGASMIGMSTEVFDPADLKAYPLIDADGTVISATVDSPADAAVAPSASSPS